MLRRSARSRSRLPALALVAVVAALAPGAAWATRAPTDAEQGAIESTALAACTVLQPNCKWNGALVSDVDDEYAYASAVGDSAAYDAILYRNANTTNDWTVLIAQSGSQRACAEYTNLGVPAVVLDDFDIKGLEAGSPTPVACGKAGPKPATCKPVTVQGRREEISVLHLSCSKARSLATSAMKHGNKPPSGWVWPGAVNCSSFIVAKKYRKITYPLVELPKTAAVVFLDDVSTPTCLE